MLEMEQHFSIYLGDFVKFGNTLNSKNIHDERSIIFLFWYANFASDRSVNLLIEIRGPS